jgi:HEAT repeat protein
MLKLIKSFVMISMVVIVGMMFCLPVQGQDQHTTKDLHGRYKQSKDPESRKKALIELSKSEPKTADDVSELRAIFSNKDYDEHLFEAAIESIKKVQDPKLDSVLIEILKDEKPFVDRAAKKDFAGKGEGELARRGTSIIFVIARLGEIRSKKAVSILKEYLSLPNFQYEASQALAKIGDKSASEQLRDKAYKGDDVNYGGQGSDEALTIVRDLGDKNKKDKWPKIAKQIIHIHDPKAKPQLKSLFNHEVMHVRWESAAKFRQLVDENDVAEIIEMTKNPDDIVRVEAIHAMKNLKNIEFGDELISLLNDPAYIVRLTAAKAIGYKHILRAVPYLEKAIRDSETRFEGRRAGKNEYQNELGVREEAYIALYILTGKKYDYDGKTARIERKAEEQKSFPTFY